jgi:hypothetical protein
MASVSLDDRELCATAVETKDSDELSPILSELRAALHEAHTRAKELIADVTRPELNSRNPSVLLPPWPATRLY